MLCKSFNHRIFFLICCIVSLRIAAQTPINPKADQKTRAVLSYLYSIKGKNIISGMHNYPLSPTGGTQEMIGKNGRLVPGLWGSDMECATNSEGPNSIVQGNRLKLMGEVVKQWKAGSVICLSWHQVKPGLSWNLGFNASKTATTDDDFNRIITPGTSENGKLLVDIDDVAKYLKMLQDSGVVVLWRPYHELNGKWFWWGGHPRTKEIFRLMYDRYTNHHGLNNLLWVWSPNVPSYAPSSVSYFPGHSFVDVLAFDYYSPFEQSYYNELKTLAEGKPLAIGECGPVISPSVLKNNQSEFVWFMFWPGFIQGDPQPLFSDPFTLTRNELPRPFPPNVVVDSIPVATISRHLYIPECRSGFQKTAGDLIYHGHEALILSAFDARGKCLFKDKRVVRGFVLDKLPAGIVVLKSRDIRNSARGAYRSGDVHRVIMP